MVLMGFDAREREGDPTLASRHTGTLAFGKNYPRSMITVFFTYGTTTLLSSPSLFFFSFFSFQSLFFSVSVTNYSLILVAALCSLPRDELALGGMSVREVVVSYMFTLNHVGC
ncbi:hypothetical protein B9Z19DRAFT_1111384 [Tuber borchii]|uniref:Uncharacterized protein n=1 Tax=Tuber borchii TaxID=42251 RepID=A0A2T6ZCF5_TUBBO|nr:hypothetical protein B9Z19DRAFT_1111384 [Tuber borchii]